MAAPTLAKRHELVIEMQKLEYNQGGYIIPFFNNLIDAYSSKVVGFVPSKGTLNLDAFGHGYRTISVRLAASCSFRPGRLPRPGRGVR